MAIPNQQNVTQREVVPTITNKSKYDMPNSRGLRVNANPLNMDIQVGDTQAFRLAKSLSQLEPELANIAINYEVEGNKEQIQLGIQDQLKGVDDPVERRGKWREYGYQHNVAYQTANDLGTKLKADLLTKEPEADYGEWYQGWLTENGQLPDLPQEHLKTFNSVFNKAAQEVRSTDTVNREELILDKQMTAQTAKVKDVIAQLKQAGQPLTPEILRAIYNDDVGHTNQQKDAYTYNAIAEVALRDGDIDLVTVLTEKRFDEDGNVMPAMIDNSKFAPQIRALYSQVQAKRTQRMNDERTAYDRNEKDKAAQLSEDVYIRVAEIDEMETLNDRNAAIQELRDSVIALRDDVEIPIPILTMLSAKINDDNPTPTSSQLEKERELLNSEAPQREWDLAVALGEVTHGQWKLGYAENTAKKKAAANGETVGKDRKAYDNITLYSEYKDNETLLAAMAGYDSNNIDKVLSATSSVFKLKATRVQTYYRSQVRKYYNKGMGDIEAIQQGLADAISYGNNSKLFEKGAYEGYKQTEGYTKPPPKEVADKKEVQEPVVDTEKQSLYGREVKVFTSEQEKQAVDDPVKYYTKNSISMQQFAYQMSKGILPEGLSKKHRDEIKLVFKQRPK